MPGERLKETCDNCGREISDSEEAFVHGDRALCGLCYQAVSRSEASGRPARLPIPTAAGLTTKQRRALPRYLALLILGWIFIAAGVIIFVLTGCISLLILFPTNAEWRYDLRVFLAGYNILEGFFSGLVAVSIGQVLHCVRDSTQNSYHIREALQGVSKS